MAENTNKVIAIDIKTHLKMAIPICEIEGFAKGCEIAFPDAAKAFKEIGGKAHELLEAWYALEESEDDKELRFDNLPQFLWGKIDALTKERDDLKAKLAAHAELLQLTEAERVELKAKLDESEKRYSQDHERMDAAERCIDDVWNCLSPQEIADNEYAHIDIIRAYREKEAK